MEPQIDEKLLTDTEAALHLGITKELLYSYVRFAPKGDRKLKTVERSGGNYFQQTELESFDNYLKEPWSKKGDLRPEIPAYVKRYLDTEIGGHCPITGKGYPLEYAHIEDYANSLNHHHHNLIKVSNEVHTKIDNGVLSENTLLETKQRLIDTTRQQLRLDENRGVVKFLPPKPETNFFGRMEELVILTGLMESERLLIIQGLGGIGKTQLLLNAIQNVTYHCPVIWIEVESISSFQDLLLLLENALSQYLDISKHNSIVEALHDHQLTIIFDSLEGVLLHNRDQIEDFISELITQSLSIQILITCQVDLTLLDSEKMVINLKGISPQFSIQMLHSKLGDEVSLSEEDTEWFMNFCNGHPLTIKLVQSLLLYYKKSSQVIDKLTSSGDIKKPLRKEHNKDTSLEICLDVVYGSLNKNQKSILQYLQFYPAGMKWQWAIGHFEIDSFNEEIATLRQFFLLDVVTDSLKFDRIIIPNPVIPFLQNHRLKSDSLKHYDLEIDSYTKIMMEVSLIDLYYLESGKNGSPAYGIARMDDELPNLLNAFHKSRERIKNYNKENLTEGQKGNYFQIISGISTAMGKYCFTRDNYELGILFSRAGIDVNIQRGEIGIAAQNFMYLCQIQSRQYDYDGFSRTVDELKELYISTQNTQANIYFEWSKARLCRDQSLYDEALVSYKNAISFYEKELENSTEEDVEGEFAQYDQMNLVGNKNLLQSEIADIHHFLGEHQTALTWYEKSIESKIRLKDEINLMSTYNQYANCLASLERNEEAITYYFKAIKGFIQNGQLEYLSNSLSGLGSLTEANIEIARHQLLSEEVLIQALDAVKIQLLGIVELVSSNANLKSSLDKIPHEIIGKLFNITKLISLNNNRMLLCNWAQSIGNEFALNQVTEPHYFVCIINLAFCVGGVDDWKNLPDARTRMLKSILKSCLIINGGPDLKSKTRVFYWLAIWMKHTGMDDQATAEKLWHQAWESFEK
ncbi:MAG: tetratricopeptide repeat protein [Cyclobacteriaceae bacterium]